LIKRVFEGKGIPPEKLPEMASSGVPGVGIRGMQEKIHQLGSFEISSDGNGNGTIVVVTLAVDERRQLDKLKVSRANRQAIEQLARRGVLAYPVRGKTIYWPSSLMLMLSRQKNMRPEPVFRPGIFLRNAEAFVHCTSFLSSPFGPGLTQGLRFTACFLSAH